VASTSTSQNLAPPRYEFTCSDLSSAALHVRRFTLVEAMSSPYRLTIELISTDIDIDIAALPGASCELRIDREGTARSLVGVVERARQLNIVGEHLRFALEIVPAFALLEQVVNTRFFQMMGAAEIIEQVLKTGLAAHGRSLRLELAGAGAAPREYCVQYRESDYEFACRLMEEEGISYRFEHPVGGSAEVLVLMGETSQCGELDTAGGSSIAFIDRATASATVESFDSFVPVYALRTTSVVQSDFDWMAPPAPYLRERRVPDARGDREVYEHDDRRLLGDDGAMRAKRKQEQRAAQTRVFLGTSDVAELVPGVAFTLSGHPHAALDRKYLIVGVRHTGEAPEEVLYASVSEQLVRYTNECECIEAERPWRPAPLFPKPRARGLQTAIVVGPASEEIHTDEYGRIKVRFHWDRVSPFDDTASCWIRVSQRWAGAGWGSVFIPRVGMEVLVEFIDGDPDQPMVTGCVYNGNHTPPYPLPDQKTKSTTKTDSSPGGGGFNEIRFEDAKAAEEIYIHAQLDMNTVVLQSTTRTVGMDDTDTIANNQTESVGVDRTASVGNNETLSVGVSQNRTIGGNQMTDIMANQLYTITGAQDLIVGANQTVSVTGHQLNVVAMDRAITVGANESCQVFGTSTLEVGLDRTTTILGSDIITISMDHTATVTGGSTVSIGTSLAATVGADVTATIGTDVTSTIGANITLNIGAAATITVGGERSVTVGGGDTLVVTGALSITAPSITLSTGGATITMAGADIAITATGIVSISGALVETNT
jgi:type VI secretion system secreted protein VgrG